jgi:hypothetical protein
VIGPLFPSALLFFEVPVEIQDSIFPLSYERISNRPGKPYLLIHHIAIMALTVICTVLWIKLHRLKKHITFMRKKL